MSKAVKSWGPRIMGALYVAAGCMHFIEPEMYIRIMPPYLPAHALLIALSGAAEIFLGILLQFKKYRRLAAWGVILLLIAVFPANLYMYQQGGAAFGISDGALLARLPLQGLLIFWAYRYTRVS